MTRIVYIYIVPINFSPVISRFLRNIECRMRSSIRSRILPIPQVKLHKYTSLIIVDIFMRQEQTADMSYSNVLRAVRN